jgi:hypothetical protein
MIEVWSVTPWSTKSRFAHADTTIMGSRVP